MFHNGTTHEGRMIPKAVLAKQTMAEVCELIAAVVVVVASVVAIVIYIKSTML